MRGMWKSGLVALVLTWQPAAAPGQQSQGWRTGAPTAFATHGQAQQPTRLRRPVPLDQASSAPVESAAQSVQPAAYPPETDSPVRRFVRAQSPDFSVGSGPGQIPPPPPPPPPPPQGLPPRTPGEAYFCGQATSTSKAGPFATAVEGIGGFLAPGGERGCFQSDHAFDQMISPVTAPFLSQDPRSLTEIRPMFIWNNTRGSTAFFNGGDVFFFGAQGRLAITERLSLVISKLGWVRTDVNQPNDEFQSGSGFAELWLGPQFAFIRCPETGTILSGGLMFQIASGSSRVFQDTGDLTLAPYLSFGQSFFKTESGSLNFLNTTGYAFSTDNQRSDYFYSTFHLDYGICNRYYPLIELNWVQYTQNGGARNLSYEGRDMINFGSRGIAGRTDLSLAVGARIKICEGIQFGGAVEFPLMNEASMDNYRLVFDMIFRY